jgi:hypothetical protein
MRTIFSVGWALVLAVLVAGCEGPVGPPGPPGQEVAVQSFIVDFRMEDAVVDGVVASVQYDAPEITSRVVQSGIVMAYFREQGTWTALPYTYGVESAELPAVDYTVTLGYAFEAGFLEVFYEASTDIVIDDLPDQTIKVVVIENLAGTRAAGVDLTDYNAVANHYGLE